MARKHRLVSVHDLMYFSFSLAPTNLPSEFRIASDHRSTCVYMYRMESCQCMVLQDEVLHCSAGMFIANAVHISAVQSKFL